MNYPSIYLENAINELTKLPSVGKRTALRFALYLLKEDKKQALALADSIIKLKEEIKLCKHCFCISDEEECQICKDDKRDKETICVVENVSDVMAIENTNSYKGVYHVLGGVISPIDGISASDLTISSLIKRISSENIKEIILALPTTLEGDTTCFYINKLVKEFNIKVSCLSRGVACSDTLEYTDPVTLARSISGRLDFDKIYSNNSD